MAEAELGLKNCGEFRRRVDDNTGTRKTMRKRILKKLKPVHPGEILREEFMAPLSLSMNKMALDLRVPVTRIADIVSERRGITADTALRFARYFKTSASFWMNLQTRYDLEVAEDEIADKVERDVRPLASAD